MSIHMAVRDLPHTLQAALKGVGYGRKEIRVERRETVSIACMGGDGMRGFAVVVNLSTGDRREHWGSWGGPNMFSSPRVDCDREEHALPPDGAVIRGSTGGGKPVYATITVHPSCMILALPPATAVTPRQVQILATIAGIRGGYRKEYLERGRVRTDEIDALVTAGMLARNRAGAISVTIAGRNACGNTRMPYGSEWISSETIE